MDKIRIVFFDIDGTLIDMERKEISAKTLEALRRLKERNVILCLATGRGPLTLPHFDGVEFDAFLTFNGSYCFNRTQTIFSNPLLIPANGGKGVGIQQILSHYHLEPSSALAFGDGDNDIEMLQAVGHGVAMGNASERLKALASDICGPVAQDGVYHYCLAHNLLG